MSSDTLREPSTSRRAHGTRLRRVEGATAAAGRAASAAGLVTEAACGDASAGVALVDGGGDVLGAGTGAEAACGDAGERSGGGSAAAMVVCGRPDRKKITAARRMGKCGDGPRG